MLLLLASLIPYVSLKVHTSQTICLYSHTCSTFLISTNASICLHTPTDTCLYTHCKSEKKTQKVEAVCEVDRGSPVGARESQEMSRTPTPGRSESPLIFFTHYRMFTHYRKYRRYYLRIRWKWYKTPSTASRIHSTFLEMERLIECSSPTSYGMVFCKIYKSSLFNESKETVLTSGGSSPRGTFGNVWSCYSCNDLKRMCYWHLAGKW